MILSCPICRKDDVIMGIDVFYCPKCMEHSCDDCLSATHWQCPNCRAKIDSRHPDRHMVRTYYAKYGILPNSSKEAQYARKRIADEIRNTNIEKARRLSEQGKKAFAHKDIRGAKEAFRKALEASPLLADGERPLEELIFQVGLAHNYALIQGMASGVENALFDMNAARSMARDAEVQKGYEVIADICNLLENTLEHDREPTREYVPASLLGGCFHLRGVYELVTGQLESAIVSLEMAVELFGDDEENQLPITYDALGMAYYRSYNLRQAQDYFEKAISLEKTTTNNEQRYARLERVRKALMDWNE